MISVIIPVYNVSDTIERCLQSVANQTIRSTPIECIIVDDCGNDDSITKVQHFIATQSNSNISYRIVHHKNNRGLSAARNTGTSATSLQSTWIYYLDSDDEMTPDALQTLLDEGLNGEFDMVCGNTITIPDSTAEKWRDLRRKKRLPRPITSNGKANRFFFDVRYVKDWIPVNAWNKLIRTSFIKNNHISFCEGLIHEDELWMFDLMRHISHIAFSDKQTYIHYVTAGSITQSGQEIRSCRHRLSIAKWELNHLDKRYKHIQRGKILFALWDVWRRARKTTNRNLIEETQKLFWKALRF